MNPIPLPTLSGPGGAVSHLQLTGSPDDKTAATIAAMRAMVHDTDRTGHVQQWAAALAAACPQKSFICHARRVYDALKNYIRFKRDTFGTEHLRHPDVLIAEISQTRGNDLRCTADCDDTAMLGAALLRAMGFRAYFVTVGLSPAAPYTHVYFGADIPTPDGLRWVPMDPQERIPFGHEAPTIARRRLWPIDI